MCWMAAIPAALAAGSAIMGSKAQAEASAAQADAERRQKIQLIKSMNYEDANLRLQQTEVGEAAFGNISQSRLQAIQNEGAVRAAAAESGMEGNTINRVQRIVAMDSSREIQGIKDNYERDYAHLFANRVGNYETTVGQVDALSGEAKKSNPLMDILGIGGAGLGGWLAGGGELPGIGDPKGGAPAPIGDLSDKNPLKGRKGG